MINNFFNLNDSVLEQHNWFFNLNLFMDNLLHSLNDRLFNILGLDLNYFMNNWNLNKALHYFFDFHSLYNRLLDYCLHNFHRFLNDWFLPNHLNFNWFFYDVPNFDNLLQQIVDFV